MRGGDDDGIGAVCSNASRNFFVAIDGGLDGNLLAFANRGNDERRMGNSVSSDDTPETSLLVGGVKQEPSAAAQKRCE